MIIEWLFTIIVREGRERKWWSTSTLVYLLVIIPCILVMEFHSLESKGMFYEKHYQDGENNVANCEAMMMAKNLSEPEYFCLCADEYKDENFKILLGTKYFHENHHERKKRTLQDIINGTTVIAGSVMEKVHDGEQKVESVAKTAVKKVGELLTLTDSLVDATQLSDSWRLILHQMLLFVLVIGRWILPGDHMSGKELTQLLLVYIAIGADIVEFMTETISDDDKAYVLCNSRIHYRLWFVWSISLFQFILNTSVSEGRKARFVMQKANRKAKIKEKQTCCGILNDSDLWGMCVCLCLHYITNHSIITNFKSILTLSIICS